MILDLTYFAASASRAMHTKGTRLSTWHHIASAKRCGYFPYASPQGGKSRAACAVEISALAGRAANDQGGTLAQSAWFPKTGGLHAGEQGCLTKYAESGWSAWVRWEWASPSPCSVPGLRFTLATCALRLSQRSPRPALMGQTRLPLSDRA